jgi:hypothetical protein
MRNRSELEQRCCRYQCSDATEHQGENGDFAEKKSFKPLHGAASPLQVMGNIGQ